ncbi:MAG: YdcH family protein [Neisseria sp.]|nr:YdcH family protein [Neisseria sp.]
MFPEYRDLISRLKNEDARFARLFEEHNDLDHQIIRLESNPVTGGLDQIDDLKRQKLRLKDQLYEILKRAESEGK